MAAGIVAALLTLAGCGEPEERARVVVVFVSLDREYSEPILKEFTRRTGIEVLPVFDAEAAKTTGLVNRLLLQRNDPECDVWWNNEAGQTAALAKAGVLAPYRSPQADRFPEKFRDAEDRWTGFAARARVIIYNTDLLAEADVPRDLERFTDPRWRGKAAIALPYFGTTFTHMMTLRQRWGDDRLVAWLRGLRANDAMIAPGNGPVRDLVAAGEAAFGLTDTDDAYAAMLDGKPVGVVLPDPQAGVTLIPNTVAVIAGAPHPEEARQLVDYLLSPEVERTLLRARGAQIPLGTDLADEATPWDTLLADTPPAAFDLVTAAKERESLIELLRGAGVDR